MSIQERSSRRSFRLGIGAVIFVAAPVANAAIEFAPVLQSGQPSPGVPGKTVNFFPTFSSDPHPLITNANSANPVVLFQASNFSPFARTIYRGTQGNVSAVVTEGTQAPGLPAGVTLGTFRNGNIELNSEKNTLGTFNNAGQLFFRSTLSGTGVDSTNNVAYYFNDGATNQLVFRKDTTNTSGPAVPSDVLDMAMNQSGQVFFQATLDGAPPASPFTNEGFYLRQTNGSLVRVFRNGDAFPGSGGTERFGFNAYPHINDNGRFAFLAQQITDNSGNTAANGSALVYGDASNPAAMSVALRAGQAATGFGAGSTYSSELRFSMNNANQVVANVGLQGPNINFGDPDGNEGGIVKGSLGGAFTKVAQTNDPVPGQPGAEFAVFRPAIINSAGKVAFIANERNVVPGSNVVETTGHWGIYSDRSGTVQLVARNGQSIPGLPAGVVLGQMDDPTMNALNHIAFLTPIVGVGVNDSNDRAIAAEIGGVLQIVAREGDPFTVAPGDVRTINEIGFVGSNANTAGGLLGSDKTYGLTGLQEGKATWFNDNDQVIFWASFLPSPGRPSGSQGIFLANVTAVPEPAGVAVFALLGGALAARRRRV